MAAEDRFIGRGWSFPPLFEAAGTGAGARGAVAMAEGVEDIRQALRILVSTTLGERLMRPEFGCALDERVFHPMNASMLSYVEALVRSAILYHEPRIDAERVEVTGDDPGGRLDIHVAFAVRGANSRFNMVFPYYLEERG
jgi:phage baseplate assembly protein W